MQEVIDFNLLKKYDTALKEVLGVWTKQKAYSINDTIQYKGKYLKCTTAGTTGTTTLNFTGLDVGDTINDGTAVWEIVDPPSGGVDLPEWQANTAYIAGKYLVHEGTVYKVITNFTSGTEFDDTNLSAYIAPIMTGANDEDDGKSGIVPAPTTNDVNKVLCGDGTWAGIDSGRVYITHKTLFSGTFNDLVINTPITLADNVNNYDKINILGKTAVNPSDGYASIEALSTSNIGYFINFVFNGASMTPNYMIIGSGADTTAKFYVEGIKFIPSNSGEFVSKDLLWSGTHLDIASVSSVTLTDDVTNYDVIVMNAASGGASCYAIVDTSITTISLSAEELIDNTSLKVQINGYIAISSPNILNFITKSCGSFYTSSNPCPISVWGLKYIQNPNDYSTTERRIGTWIDGKPLYQKTYTGTSVNVASIPIDINIDTVVEIEGCTNYSGVDFPLNYYVSSSEYGSCVIGFNSTTSFNDRVIYLSYSNSTRDYNITIKYTKV